MTGHLIKLLGNLASILLQQAVDLLKVRDTVAKRARDSA